MRIKPGCVVVYKAQKQSGITNFEKLHCLRKMKGSLLPLCSLLLLSCALLPARVSSQEATTTATQEEASTTDPDLDYDGSADVNSMFTTAAPAPPATTPAVDGSGSGNDSFTTDGPSPGCDDLTPTTMSE